MRAVLTVSRSENTVLWSTKLSARVMNPAPLAPSIDQDLRFVLCAFGRSGLAYLETDPMEADATTIVHALLRGLYDRPLRVIALNLDEGWSQDVSEAIAAKVRQVAHRADRRYTRVHRDAHRTSAAAYAASVVIEGGRPLLPRREGGDAPAGWFIWAKNRAGGGQHTATDSIVRLVFMA
jgi:hypothetical protein